MPPRRDPWSSRNIPRDCPPRSRLTRLAANTDESFSEVPDYLVCPKAKTRKDLMKRASCLKAGVTGHGCPPGYSGVIVYPLSELETALLNSMGDEPEPEAVVADGPGAVIGQPPQDEVVVPAGEIPEVGGGPGVPIGQPPQDEVVVPAGESPEVGGGPGVPMGLQEVEGIVQEG